MARGEDEYFLGSIVIKQSSDGSAPEIVDGQQRLATSTILLAAIRDFFANKNDVSRVEGLEKDYLFSTDFRTQDKSPRLTLNGSDQSYFMDTVLERPGGAKRNRAPGKNKGSEENLKLARELAAKHVATLAGSSASPTRLFDLTEYLKIKAKIIWVEVPDDANAYMIFEALNDRGRELAISDLLKNHLFKESKGNLEHVKRHWIGMTAVLEAVADEIIVDFIRHYWSSAYGLTRDRQLYEEFKKQVTDKKTALEFAATIEKEAARYAAIISQNHSYWATQTQSSRDYIDILNRRLGMVRMRPLLLALMSTIKSKKEVEKSLRYLVNAGARLTITGGGGTGTTEQAYASTAKSIRDGAIKTVAQLHATMKSIVPTDDQFRDAFKIASVSKGRIARYYLQSLEKQKAGETQPEWIPNENEDQLNLEHVMPQVPSADWIRLDPDIIRTYTKRMGNLALLPAGVNSGVGNESFASKKAKLAASTLKLTSMIGTQTKWTPAEIQKRQDKLADLAVKTWPNKP